MSVAMLAPATVPARSHQSQHTRLTWTEAFQVPTRRLGQAAPTLSKAPCRLASEKVWLRKSGQYGTVGAKPKTTCSVPVSLIWQSTQLQHQFLGLWLAAGQRFNADAKNSGVLGQKNVAVTCNGTELTRWRAVTFGAVVYLGREFRTSVTTDEADLRCSY